MSDQPFTSISAIVLVGGFGTRIRHITGSTPKPLAAVFGKPFLHWVFRNLKRKNVGHVYLLTHFGAELIEKFASNETDADFKIECVRESTPSGTGGCVLDFLSTRPRLSDPFLLLNGDSLLMDYDIAAAQKQINNGYAGVIFGVEMEDVSRYGTLKFDDQMALTSFEEKKPGKGIINSGVYLLSSQLFSKIKNPIRPLSLEKDIIPLMISSGKRIYVMREQSPFIDIGTEVSLREADVFIKENFGNDYSLEGIK